MTGALRMLVEHRFAKAQASAYLDGELARPERERLEAHTAVCPKCRALLASLRRMVELLPGLAASPRPRVTDGVLDRLRREGGAVP